ncbi:hypothetical protein J6590_055110 [Homalodisca vitripennis]|nr:hypothetical protein J6590_055110 [Homalodisca vitripennis]
MSLANNLSALKPGIGCVEGSSSLIGGGEGTGSILTGCGMPEPRLLKQLSMFAREPGKCFPHTFVNGRHDVT